MCQSCLDTSWLAPATAHIGQSFLGTNQTILFLIKKRKVQAEKSVSITPYVSQSNSGERYYDSASPHVS